MPAINYPLLVVQENGARVKGKMPTHFELLDVQHRRHFMAMAGWLLEDWPTRFIKIAKQAEIPLKTLVQDNQDDLPFWYMDVVLDAFSTAHAPWRPSGVAAKDKKGSYTRLASRRLSPVLAARAKRLEFIRANPDLAGQPRSLAKAMKSAGLYSPKTQIHTIEQSIGPLIEQAKQECTWWQVGMEPCRQPIGVGA